MAEQVRPDHPSADPPQSASPRNAADRDAPQPDTDRAGQLSPDYMSIDDLDAGYESGFVDNSSIGDSAVDLPDVSSP